MRLTLNNDEINGIIARLKTLLDLYLLYHFSPNLDSFAPSIVMTALDIYDSILSKYSKYNDIKECIKNNQLNKLKDDTKLDEDILEEFVESVNTNSLYRFMVNTLLGAENESCIKTEYKKLFDTYLELSNLPNKSALKNCIKDKESYPDHVLRSFDALDTWWKERNEYTHNLKVYKIHTHDQIKEMMYHTLNFVGYTLSSSSSFLPVQVVSRYYRDVAYELLFVWLLVQVGPSDVVRSILRCLIGYSSNIKDPKTILDDIKNGMYIEDLKVGVKESFLSALRSELVRVGYDQNRIQSMYSNETDKVYLEWDSDSFSINLYIRFPKQFSDRKINRVKSSIERTSTKIKEETWIDTKIDYL